jgi:outer membrane protein OmpA-like peptidoglycan-associated protein
MFLPSTRFLATVAIIGSITCRLSAAENFAETGYKITQFISAKAGAGVVLIDGGREQGVVDGAIFTSYRAKPGANNSKDAWIATGVLKALDVKENFTVAQILEQNSPLAIVFFPKFPGVMAGDYVKEKQMNIAPAIALTPATTLTFEELFVDPRRAPESYELSENGKEQLREAAKAYAGFKLNRLMIEGHCDAIGPADENQVESYQRALTVMQFLNSELKFEKSKLAALGYGETELLVDDFTPGHEKTNRRIVLKALAH